MWYKCLDCIFATNSPQRANDHDRTTDHTTVEEPDV